MTSTSTSRADVQTIWLSALVCVFAFAVIVTSGIDLGAHGASGFASLSIPDSSVSVARLFVATLMMVATALLVAHSRARLNDDPHVARVAAAATALMFVQLGALFVAETESLTPHAVATHFGATALLLATAMSAPLARERVTQFVRSAVGSEASLRGQSPLTQVAAVATLGALMSGAYLAASGHAACSGWPLCSSSNGGSALSEPQNHHRILVALSGALLLAIATRLWRGGARPLAPLLALVVFLAEAGVGALATVTDGSALVSGSHFGAAAGTWLLLVAVVLAATPARGLATEAASTAWKARARDYARVTKPGIMALLLTTTLGAMLVAPGWPSVGLILATLLGGALASGGASALNCYLDRDIDVVMARTRRRPIPTGSLTPRQVRNFGLALSALAVVELWLLVNPVAALLALGGNLFYVVIYTRFLKRSTPQNIVIGGAAGAFPPLVGWAAVTGTVSLTAVLLFAIIYFWTPPHFWSLALLKSRDYERAGIPMLPVTHGDQQTRKHILLYSFMLVAITLLAVPAGAAGVVYFAAALALGALFVVIAARMYTEGTSRLAWRLFKYSNYYLAALLLAMVLDRALLA